MPMKLHPTPENPLPPGAECLELVTADKVQAPGHARAAGRGARNAGHAGRARRLHRALFRNHAGCSGARLCRRSRGPARPGRIAAQQLPNPTAMPPRSFADFEEDVRTLMDGLVIPTCPPPYYALGHSTGGHILLRVLREQRLVPQGDADLSAGRNPLRPVAEAGGGAAGQRGDPRGLWLPLPAGRPEDADGPGGFPGKSPDLRPPPLGARQQHAGGCPASGAGRPDLRLAAAAARRSLKEIKAMEKPRAPVLIVAGGRRPGGWQ